MALAQRACLHLRAARRVLMPLGAFDAADADALYEGAAALPWHEVVDPDGTFAVEASIKDSAFHHSGFVALKVKDAVADCMRRRTGRRPDVDRKDPATRVVLHVNRGRAEVSVDLSGGPLHKRGYRERHVAAPLNETLAAGILLLLGYDGERPFADPFCGSGTFAVEAALIACRIPPGLLRGTPFGFERLPGFKRAPWKEALESARAGLREPPHAIAASDRDGSAVRAAEANAAAAGVQEAVKVKRQDALAFAPPRGAEGGLVVSNLPYGDHAGEGEDLAAVYKGFGDALKANCAGWTAAILTGAPALAKTVGLHPARRVPLWNGPVECRLLVYELYKGSKKPAADAEV